MISRRGFVTGLVGLLAAPAIVKYEWIMPVKSPVIGNAIINKMHLLTNPAPILEGWKFLGWQHAVYDAATGLYRMGPLEPCDRPTEQGFMFSKWGHDPPCENPNAPVAVAT